MSAERRPGADAGSEAPPAKGRAGAAGLRRRRLANALLLVVGLLAAAAVRYPLLDYESGDFFVYLRPWYDFITHNGHFAALRHDFSNYSPPYLYLLTIFSLLAPSMVQLLAIKIVSLVFDLTLAWYVFRVVGLKYRESATVPILAGIAALLFPTAVVNSAMWAQADTIYTTFLVGSLYFVLRRRPAGAFLMWGIAFALKAQAVFLLPLFYWLAQRRALDLRSFWLAPLPYLAALVPTWFLGRPFYELLLVYLSQAGEVAALARDAPNLYQWISNDWYPYWPLGVLLTVGVVLGIGRLLRRSRAEITPEIVVSLAAFSVLLAPYLLPKMHDRYFFPADLFALVLAFYRPRFLAAPIVIGSCSFIASLLFLRSLEVVPVPYLSAAMLLVVLGLGRRLFLDFGFAGSLHGGGERLRAFFLRQVRQRRGALLPAAALVLSLAAVFALFGERGRFERPLRAEPASALTLARAANRAAETHFVGFSRRALDASGAVSHDLDRRASLGGDLLLSFLLGGAEFDLSLGLRSARTLMTLLFLSAALFAYLGLRRLFGSPWTAFAATLFAFSSFAAGAFDAVAAEAAPALFSVCFAFHGLAVFREDGRLRPLLVRCGAALLLHLSAFALLAPFAAFGVLAERLRQRAGNGSARRTDGAAGAVVPGSVVPEPGVPEPGVPEPGVLEPGVSEPVVPGSAGAVAGRHLLIGAFAAAVVVGALSLQAANEAAFSAAGRRGTAAAPHSSTSYGGDPMRRAVGSPESASSETRPASPPDSVRDPSPANSPLSFLEARFGGVARLFAPYALLRGTPPPAVSAPSSASGPGESPGESPRAPAVIGFLLTALAIGGAAFSPQRALLLPLALGGVFCLLAPGSGPPLPHAAANAGALALPLVGFALGASALRRVAEGRWVRPAALAAAAVFLVSAHRVSAESGGRGVPGPAARDHALGARVREDFGRIRRLLGARPPEERAVFAPPGYGGGVAGAAETAWYLAGNLVVGREEQRRSAEFVLSAERRPGRGLLTPDNEEVFLYHRAAYDGELDALIAAAGEPVIRSDFEVRLADGRLLYVREGCRAEDRAGTFILHLLPVDGDDLPPARKAHGFDNRSFRFHAHAFEQEERCVAGVPLPDYPIRHLITGRYFRRPLGGYVEGWRGEYTLPPSPESTAPPSAASPPAESPSAASPPVPSIPAPPAS